MIAATATFERFAGRRGELDFLIETFVRAKSESAGAAVLIGGESGIGKTRLLREFTLRIQRERCAVLSGSCLEYVATPYEPFIEAFANEKNAALLEQELRGVATERAPNAEAERLRRFRSIEDHLRRRAATMGSLVLIVEDLHWSDASTVDLLRFLVRRLSDAPVMIVATFRSDDLEADHARMVRFGRLARDGLTQIILLRLDERDIVDLLASAVVPRDLLAREELMRISELSEGRPLVAEELLRGALQRARRPEAAPREPAPSIRATVLERMSEFDDAALQVMLHAAVVGREFDVDLLGRLVGLPQERILQTLRRARGLQLIVEGVAAGTFRFRHAITREILYHELLQSEARILHERIAVVLDREGAARRDEAAYHWWAAGNAGHAVDANEAAGDRATAIYAYADAARSYERALSFATGDGRARIVEKVAFALCATGEMERARNWCADAAAELHRAGRRETANRLLLWVGRQLYEAGEVDRALETVDAVRDDVRRAPASPIQYAADMTLAGILATLGRAQEALAILDGADLLPCEHEPIDEFRSHNARGNVLCSLGSYAEALAEYGKALAIAESLDNVELRLHAMGNAGNAALLLGDVTRAAESSEAALELARRHGLERHAVILLSGAACAALYRGDLGRARQAYDELVTSRSGAAMTVGFAQAIGIRLSDLVDGFAFEREDVDAAVEAAFRLRESQTIAVVAGAAARSALERGEVTRAADLVERGIAAITEPDHAYWLCDAASEVGGEVAAARALLVRACADGTNRAAGAHLDLFDARCAALAGDAPRSRELATRSAEAFGLLPWPFEAASALELAGALDEARRLYERHGATRAARRVAAKAGATPVALARADALTKREAEVAELAARGYISRQIGEELGIGERTVETHLATVYRKLGVKTRVELASRLRAGTRA
jgi:DNA-binding CsgD family transcriptional regulator/predicted negative regulator of RcsB-dependent stress response